MFVIKSPFQRLYLRRMEAANYGQFLLLNPSVNKQRFYNLTSNSNSSSQCALQQHLLLYFFDLVSISSTRIIMTGDTITHVSTNKHTNAYCDCIWHVCAVTT